MFCLCKETFNVLTGFRYSFFAFHRIRFSVFLWKRANIIKVLGSPFLLLWGKVASQQMLVLQTSKKSQKKHFSMENNKRKEKKSKVKKRKEKKREHKRNETKRSLKIMSEGNNCHPKKNATRYNKFPIFFVRQKLLSQNVFGRSLWHWNPKYPMKNLEKKPFYNWKKNTFWTVWFLTIWILLNFQLKRSQLSGWLFLTRQIS